jgi:hypothetical protein
MGMAVKLQSFELECMDMECLIRVHMSGQRPILVQVAENLLKGLFWALSMSRKAWNTDLCIRRP